LYAKGKEFGIRLIVMLLRGCHRPSKLVVEKHSSASGHIRTDRIENLTVGFVFVGAVIDKISNEPRAHGAAPGIGSADTGLMLTESQGVLISYFVFLFIAEKRNGVPNGREAQTQNQRILRRVDELVNVVGLEPRAEIEIGRARTDNVFSGTVFFAGSIFPL
jgi:hypothetical protein